MSPDPKPSSALLIGVFLTAQIVSMLGSGSFPALLPLFVEEWGLSKTDAGWINGVYFAGYLCAVPVLVSLTDRVPPRRIYILCVLVSAVSGFGFALFTDGFWSAIVFRTLGGIGIAGTYMPGLKLLNDHLEQASPDRDHSRATAFYVSGFGLGMSLSYFVTDAVTEAFDWHWAFAVAGIGPLFAIGLIQLALPTKDPELGLAPATHLLDFRPVLRCRVAMAYVLAYAVHNFELFALRSWLVAFLVFAAATHPGFTPPASAATITGVAILLGPIGSILGNEMSRRVGRRQTVTFLMLTSTAVAFAFGFVADLDFRIVIAASIFYAVLVTADSASITAGVIAAAPTGYRGATMAVHSSIGFLGSFLGPVAFGVVLDLADPSGIGGSTMGSWISAFVMSGVVVALGPVALALLGRQPTKPSA